MLLEEKIGIILKKKKLTIAIAESCTGGLIAHRITNVPGASAYLETGFVTYSNRAKELFLKVPGAIIAKKGAVSGDVAQLMAEGARKAAGADIGLSVTGIAGPGGGTKKKPVGTVFMGLSHGDKTLTQKCFFSGSRTEIKSQTSEEALRFLMKYIEGKI